MSWTYQTCDKCGGPISFVKIDGRPIPIHEGGGGCPGRAGWFNYGMGASKRRTSEGLEFEFPFVAYPSYVQPNARCPACDKLVYFYQSGNGVWVLFDELGPPWKEHGCIADPKVRREFGSAEGRTKFLLKAIKETREPAWVDDQWKPFVVVQVVERRMGIEALGDLHEKAGGRVEKLRIWQESTEMSVWKQQGALKIGFNLVMNAGMVVEALYESPVMLRRQSGTTAMELGTFAVKDGVTPLTTVVEAAPAGS